MNVIIANKYKEMLMSLDIEVIKSMEGVFSIDELISTFQNFFFNKMILDITSIENYQDTNNIQKLSVAFDMDKIILVLDNSPESESRDYLTKLISMGIYNFTRNAAGINYLLAHPNSYRDVVHIQNLHAEEEKAKETQIINKVDETVYVESPRLKIIGIKSLTQHSGATTLTYLMKKRLDQECKVIAMEVNKNDFLYLNDQTLVTTSSADLPKELMKHRDYEVALIDLNNYEDDGVCSDVLYLVEPSTLKLNKLMKRNNKIFEKLKDKKIILVNSLLTPKDVEIFEYESKVKVFMNIPPLNDRNENLKSINTLLNNLGLISRE